MKNKTNNGKKKRSDLWLPEAGWGVGTLGEVVKMHKLPVVRYISTGNVLENTMALVNATV